MFSWTRRTGLRLTLAQLPAALLPAALLQVALLPAALLPAALVAQVAPPRETRTVRAIDEAAWLAEGLEAVTREGVTGVTAVRWRRGDGVVDTIPLTPARERIALGRAGAGVLVVLAGGVRDSLDVYLARASGEIRRFSTDGGRRLPGSFAAGVGSWPVAVGADVFVLAYQKDERCELRALGFGEQMFASRSLPVATTGFEVQFESATSQIVVTLAGAAGVEPIRFLHPDAPRLHVERGLLEFGTLIVGASGRDVLRVTNAGNAALAVGLTLVGSGFALEGPARLDLAAGAHTELAVSFTPPRAGAYQGALHLGVGELGEPLQVVLRGVALVPTPEPAPPSAVAAAPKNDAMSPPAGQPVESPAADAVVAVPAPQPVTPTPKPVTAPPALALVEGLVEVTGRPGEVLWLTSVTMDDERDRPLRPIATWRVRLPGGGEPLRLPAESLGPIGQAVSLLALRRDGGELCESAVLTFTVSRR